MTAQPKWFESELNDEGFTAVLNGIEADVWFDIEDGRWTWTVKPSAERCEWPELWDFGDAASPEEAQAAAWESAQRADKSFGFVTY